MKDSKNTALWYRSEADINRAIHQRIIHTHSQTPALKHFDGNVMESYRIPSIVFQSAYCKKFRKPKSCSDEMSKKIKNVPTFIQGGNNSSYIGNEPYLNWGYLLPPVAELMHDSLQGILPVKSDLSSVQNYFDVNDWDAKTMVRFKRYCSF